MLKKMLRKKFKREHIIIASVILTLCVIGFVVFLVILSDDGEGQGTSQATEVREYTEHRLVRITADEVAWVGGVLAGIAYYLGFPLWLLRLFFIIGVLWGDEVWENTPEVLIVGYILLWFFMPVIDFIPADFAAVTG